MKIIDSNGKIFGKFNILDLIVLIALVFMIGSGLRYAGDKISIPVYDEYYVRYEICGFEQWCNWKVPYFLVEAINEGEAIKLKGWPDGTIEEVFFQRIDNTSYKGYLTIKLPVNNKKWGENELKLGERIILKTEKYDLDGQIMDFSRYKYDLGPRLVDLSAGAVDIEGLIEERINLELYVKEKIDSNQALGEPSQQYENKSEVEEVFEQKFDYLKEKIDSGEVSEDSASEALTERFGPTGMAVAEQEDEGLMNDINLLKQMTNELRNTVSALQDKTATEQDNLTQQQIILMAQKIEELQQRIELQEQSASQDSYYQLQQITQELKDAIRQDMQSQNTDVDDLNQLKIDELTSRIGDLQERIQSNSPTIIVQTPNKTSEYNEIQQIRDELREAMLYEINSQTQDKINTLSERLEELQENMESTPATIQETNQQQYLQLKEELQQIIQDIKQQTEESTQEQINFTQQKIDLLTTNVEDLQQRIQISNTAMEAQNMQQYSQLKEELKKVTEDLRFTITEQMQQTRTTQESDQERIQMLENKIEELKEKMKVSSLVDVAEKSKSQQKVEEIERVIAQLKSETQNGNFSQENIKLLQQKINELQGQITPDVYNYHIILEIGYSEALSRKIKEGDNLVSGDKIIGTIKDVFFGSNKGYLLIELESEAIIRVGDQLEMKNEMYSVTGTVFEFSRQWLELGVNPTKYSIIFDFDIACKIKNSLQEGDTVIDSNGPVGVIRNLFFLPKDSKCYGYALIELTRMEQKYIDNYIMVGDKLNIRTDKTKISGTVVDFSKIGLNLGLTEENKKVVVKMKSWDSDFLARIDTGDKMVDDAGNVIATISRIMSQKSAEKVITTNDGRLVVAEHPFEKEVLLEINLVTQNFRGVNYFNGQNLKLNSELNFDFGDYIFKGEVEDII